jgi:hypothetical protein
VLVRRLSAIVLVLVTALPAAAANYRTTNFYVTAPDAQTAKQCGDYAEHYRKEKALMWLGQEMPTWPQPCPLIITVSMEGPSGATSFQFGQGRILGMKMEIQGPLDRLLASVLPHEITHTVFAHYFKQPVPRWADEGGSVLSEDDIERDRHDRLTRQILNRGQQIPLRKLFGLREYPPQVMCLYAEGFSMSDYLVKRSDHKTFLHFVGHGMQHGWDSAVQSFYGHRTVEELEEAWLKNLRETRRGGPSQPQAPAQVASNGASNGNNNPGANSRPQGQTTSRPIVRLTAPQAQGFDGQPVFRGVAADPNQNFVPPPAPPAPPQAQMPPPGPPGPTGWQPGQGRRQVAANGQPGYPVPVTLGPPQSEFPPAAPSVAPVYPPQQAGGYAPPATSPAYPPQFQTGPGYLPPPSPPPYPGYPR